MNRQDTSSGLLPFYAHFLHSFRPFFANTLDTVCVGKVTSARNVFKPDLERCKRESQEAQHSTAMWRPGQQCWQQVGQQEVVGQQGRGRARSNCGHPAGRTQPHCWCSSSSPGARLQRKHVQIEYILGKQIERNKIEYIRNKQTEYIREEELTSDDVDHGAGEVGVWRSTRVLPTIRVPHLQVVSFGQLGNYVLHCWRCKQNMLNNCCSYNRKAFWSNPGQVHLLKDFPLNLFDNSWKECTACSALISVDAQSQWKIINRKNR